MILERASPKQNFKRLRQKQQKPSILWEHLLPVFSRQSLQLCRAASESGNGFGGGFEVFAGAEEQGAIWACLGRSFYYFRMCLMTSMGESLCHSWLAWCVLCYGFQRGKYSTAISGASWLTDATFPLRVYKVFLHFGILFWKQNLWSRLLPISSGIS